MGETDRIVLVDLMLRISWLKDSETMIEDETSMFSADGKDISLPMAIPVINVYYALVIATETDDNSRFHSKENPASYAGLVSR